MCGCDGRREIGRRFLPGAVLLLALVLAPAASARVTLVATGTPELVFVGIPRNEVVARLALPGPSRAVAVSRDGTRGFVSAAGDVVATDVNLRTETGRTALGPGPEISDIELSPGGETLYAVRGPQLLVIDAQTLTLRVAIELRGPGGALAVSNDGALAAVALTTGRVALVGLGTNALLRHVKLKGATGVAIADTGTTYVSARARVRLIDPGQHKARKKPVIKLPEGAGGLLTLSPGRSRLVVAAAAGGRAAALVDLNTRRVQRLPAGAGPGRAAWYPDASRIVFADGGGASISLISPFSRARIGLILLAGTTPSDLVVQPGLATNAGTEGPDSITGTRGSDRLVGLGGDDILRGGRDRDSLDGGPGADQLSGGPSSDSILGGEGNDFMSGGTGDDTMRGGPGDDGAGGGTGNDSIYGEDGNDTLDGGDGDDTVLGGPGDDTIVEKGFGDDKELNGGPGNDVIRGGRGSDRLILGEEGDDQLFGETGSERIIGGDGNDLIDGGRAGDRLEGENGEDTIKGDAGNDHLYGGRGNDKLDGGSGTDELFGHEENDELVGGNGPDLIDGGPGDDTIRAADDSADTVNCGDGNDTVYVEADAPTRDLLNGCETVVPVPAEPDSDLPGALTIRGTRNADVINGSPFDDTIFGRGGADKIFGMPGNDYVDGDKGDDQLHGGPGDDLMPGRQGNDKVWGDEGNDRITGDRGNDTIWGGAGNDTIFGNIGSDRVDGGPGDDRINMVDKTVDHIICGRGSDVVFADVRDKIAKDCESVRR